MKVAFKKIVLNSLAVGFISFLTGCTGSTYNKEKNCSYDYLLHPAVSISKMIGGCGTSEK